jgi:hypothetical protein
MGKPVGTKLASKVDIGVDGYGWHHCLSCGNVWKEKRVKLWWPIKLHWVRGSIPSLRRWRRIGKHGVQLGLTSVDRLAIRRIWSLGPLRILFGPEALTDQQRAWRWISDV